jgi:uncharacterized protein
MAGYNFGELFSTELGFFALFLIFDALAAMLLGMIAFRIGLLQGKWPTWGVALLGLGAFGLGLPLNWWETKTVVDSDYSVHAFLMSSSTYHVGRVLLALGWLSVALLIATFGDGLGAVGRMALSNYLAQSIIAAVFFIGLGYFGKLARHELYYVVAGIWAFNIVFSLIWLRFFAMGPFEWLWRAGTYGTWPPLSKNSATEPAASEA